MLSWCYISVDFPEFETVLALLHGLEHKIIVYTAKNKQTNEQKTSTRSLNSQIIIVAG